MNYKSRLHRIKTFIFDFDGVMTDGSIWTYANDECVRAGNVKDGFALQYAKKKGYNICVISGAVSNSIVNRMRLLGIEDVFTGCTDKMQILTTYCQNNNINFDEVLYMGDDIPDYDVMKAVAVATCPADAAIEIKSIADYISLKKGGMGCVRDVIEQVLRLQNKWFHQDAIYW